MKSLCIDTDEIFMETQTESEARHYGLLHWSNGKGRKWARQPFRHTTTALPRECWESNRTEVEEKMKNFLLLPTKFKFHHGTLSRNFIWNKVSATTTVGVWAVREQAGEGDDNAQLESHFKVNRTKEPVRVRMGRFRDIIRIETGGEKRIGKVQLESDLLPGESLTSGGRGGGGGQPTSLLITSISNYQ